MTAIKTTTREASLIAVALVVGLALRAAAIISFRHSPESDELAYISMALNLLHNGQMADDMGNRAFYNMGYPFFVLTPVFQIFGENYTAARIANLFLGGAAILLCWAVAKEAGAGPIGRLLAAFAWSVYLPASVYTVYLFKENLMTPLMLGVLWCALRLYKQPTAPIALLCGALFGLLALTGNAALSLSAAVLLALILSSSTWAERSRLALITTITAVMVAAPWAIRNASVLGTPVLNTNGGFNLYLGNNPAANGFFVSIADTPRGSTWEDLRKMGEVHASETLKSEAIDWIKRNPQDFAHLAISKLFYFWKPPLHEGKGYQSLAERTVRQVWAIQYLMLGMALCTALLVRRLWSKQLGILAVAIVSYAGVHGLFYVIFRYREPIMPLVVTAAALALESLAVNRVTRLASRPPLI